MTQKPRHALWERVSAVLDQLRSVVQGDGGDIELVNIDADGVVHIRLHGTCVGCPSSAVTLTYGIERSLVSQVPQIARVECVPADGPD